MKGEILGDDRVAATLARALGSQYQVLRLLGRGGMGTVYLAREPFLERDVAVKVLPSELASGTARERFLREARTAARLSHPNIVPLYTFGQADDVLYYVMGYVEGESLEARLQREGRLPPDEVRRITSELAEALEYAHQMGVVHRDLKPDNVLLDRATGRALLTDFGVAKAHAQGETLTQTGMIVGTPHYMSPEQASGDRDIDGRSDIYALGVMAYRMATGRLPFEGSGLRELLAQHATRSPVPPTQIVTDLPLDIDTVITRALAKDPAERWPNARMVREALSPDSDQSVPEPLQVITGMGVRTALLTLGVVQFAFIGWQFRFFDPVMCLVILAAGLVVQPLALLGLIRPVRRFGWTASLTRWFQQPSWWNIWWPRRWRVAGDVFDQLPKDVRRVRTIGLVANVVNLVLANLMTYAMTEDYRSFDPATSPMRWFSWAVFPVMAAYGIPMLFLARRFQKRGKAAGLSGMDMQRVLGGSTAPSSFWTRPHIASLLSPVAATSRPAESREPRAVVLELESVAAKEATSPHADVFREAAAAAARLVAAFDRAGEELGQLARDLDPRERERIQASLDALGARAASASAAKSQMRELLERQLQIFQELESRRDAVSSRREHLAEQLRTLALHVARLRAADATSAPGEITGEIRSVMREIEYRVQGADAAQSALRS